MNRLLLIEDNCLQLLATRKLIQGRYPAARIIEINTEHMFHVCFPLLRPEHMQAVICDARLRWTTPAPQMPACPPEIRREDNSLAGARCWKKFRSVQALRQIPWVYYTVVPKEEMGFGDHSDPQTRYLSKDASEDEFLAVLDSISKASIVHLPCR